MKPDILPKTFRILSLAGFFAFMLLSCRKEQQLPQPGEPAPALKGNSSPLSAETPSLVLQVSGGGQGSFGADLDKDGDIDGSHFSLGASVFSDGTAKGHFECLMAGNADILGLPLMAVEGRPGEGSANADGSATLKGLATVNLGNGTRFTGIPFSVTLREGGPQTGTLKLTVIGAFDGVPGDTKPGNGNYDLPTETVAKGQISFH